ncbi:LysR family transcriptional regulator [Stenotrophomonas sp. C3(2023)]|uniref:LysR family transcriptional regulator n=1 Tax=Stenotrophomonas sp. C3(2023) TaxID=3080277 RepID=UPI00293C7ECE|nr:LysR family transcriptional regulator [Stenotrophomonas sp. C3(2023)]MDV3469901.1 LysR family transcriptional regulator [Stenotrophomonas sp. C3(2023)]
MLHDIRIFLRVAELGSFTGAASSLGLPKASVSQAVRRLEAGLGTQLLHRTTRRVRLTADGARFQSGGSDLLDDAEALQGLFRQPDTALQGRLRVDMSAGLARHVVLPHLSDFMDQHPGVEIELSATDRRVDLVREGFDCVVRVGPLDDNTLVARPVGAMAVVNCASPAYLQAHGEPQTLADLQRHKLVRYVGTLGQRGAGFEYHDGQTYRLQSMPGALTVNSGDAYSAAALAGLGIIQVPRVGVVQALANGQLVEVLPQLRAEPMPVHLLYAQRRHLPRRVAVFMEWLAAVTSQALVDA